MSRRRKKIHKRRDAFLDTQPTAPGPTALAARQASGAGVHGKSGKAQRAADKRSLRKGDYE